MLSCAVPYTLAAVALIWFLYVVSVSIVVVHVLPPPLLPPPRTLTARHVPEPHIAAVDAPTSQSVPHLPIGLPSQGRDVANFAESMDAALVTTTLFHRLQRLAAQIKWQVIERRLLLERGAAVSANLAVDTTALIRDPSIGPFLPKENTSANVLDKCGRIPAATKLTVVSINLWNINPPVEIRETAVVSELVRLRPDVVGLTEVREWQGQNQAKRIQDRCAANGLEYHSVYVRASSTNADEEGLAILSKHRIVKQRRHVISLPSHANQRILVHAEIEVPDNRPDVTTFEEVGTRVLHVINTHWSYVDTETCVQAVEMYKYILNAKQMFEGRVVDSGGGGGGGSPLLVLGDFNVYFDFEFGLDILTKPLYSAHFHEKNPCQDVFDAARKAGVFTRASAAGFSSSSSSSFLPSLLASSASSSALLLDAWDELYGSAPSMSGHTFPSWVHDRRNVNDPSRPDRVLFGYIPAPSPASESDHGHSSSTASLSSFLSLSSPSSSSSSSSFSVCDVGVFGHRPIPKGNDVETMDGLPVYISDHKCLLAVFTWNR